MSYYCVFFQNVFCYKFEKDFIVIRVKFVNYVLKKVMQLMKNICLCLIVDELVQCLEEFMECVLQCCNRV